MCGFNSNCSYLLFDKVIKSELEQPEIDIETLKNEFGMGNCLAVFVKESSSVILFDLYQDRCEEIIIPKVHQDCGVITYVNKYLANYQKQLESEEHTENGRTVKYLIIRNPMPCCERNAKANGIMQ
jgi:hypothetical protein